MVGKDFDSSACGQRDTQLLPMNMLIRNSEPACVKITPAHDPNDFEVGLRHNLLNRSKVLNDDATINYKRRKV